MILKGYKKIITIIICFFSLFLISLYSPFDEFESLFINNKFKFKIYGSNISNNSNIKKKLGIGDWGLGIGDWGLGLIPIFLI